MLRNACRVVICVCLFSLPVGMATASTGAPGDLDFVDDQVLVKYEVGIKISERQDIAAASGVDLGRPIAGETRAFVAETKNPEEAADSLSSAEGVKWATPNYKHPVLAAAPNDPLFTSQWALKNTGDNWPYNGQEGEDIDALSAWDTTSGAGAVVGVIDTGMQMDHPDLVNQLWTNPTPGSDPDYPDDLHGWDFLYRDWDPSETQNSYHGTSMSGIISAQRNNAIGVSGIAPESKIMVLKAGTQNWVNNLATMEAIHYAGDR